MTKEAVTSDVTPPAQQGSSYTVVEVLATIALIWYLAVVIVCTVGYTQL